MSSHKGEIVDDDDDAMSVSSDVETLERRDCTGRLKGFLIRLIFSLIFIGACSGALIWSFTKGESGENVVEHQDASVNFAINISEYSKVDGTYSITNRQPYNGNDNNLGEAQTYKSFWYQDDKNQRLVHRRDNQTTLFVYNSFTYWATYNKYGDILNCRYDRHLNYTKYINQLGLRQLTREHSAYETTHNHAKVYIYNGDPNEVISEGTPQEAFLVTVFADAYSGALLGWDTYFTASNSSLVYKISYWYDSMTIDMPDASHFDAPAECEPSY